MKLRIVSVCLWIAVGCALGYMFWSKIGGSPVDLPAQIESQLLKDTNWNHLQAVPRFQFTDQNGKSFDSSQLAGKPYAVNFFFTNCKTACWSLNQQVKRLTERFEGDDVFFLSITCDPKNDSPEVLKKYSQSLDADSAQWKFLTGQMYEINQLGTHAFSLNVEPQSHTEKIVVVDKWGRFRDYFDWDNSAEMERFSEVMKELVDEKQPPINRQVLTRNLIAASDLTKSPKTKWVREFQLVDSQDKSFYSKDMTGRVWLANFFFTSCPTICPQMNQYIAGLISRLPDTQMQAVSISSDPNNDSPGRLRQYRRERGFENDRWKFLTGDNPKYIERIGSEFFDGELANGEDHSSMICIVDRWGNLRGKYNWNFPQAEGDFLSFCQKLCAETEPPANWQVKQFGKSDAAISRDENGE
jgi:cytochrome oxidase Cu insertion factor (SCO1/SenC/PrrC family)